MNTGVKQGPLFWALSRAAAFVAFASLLPDPASAQILPFRSWVSSNGHDDNDCSRYTPCLTLQAAIDKTTAGGVIQIIDAGAFGPIEITKALTIEGTTGSEVFDTFRAAVRVRADLTDVVILRGLRMTGKQSAIFLESGKALYVEDCIVENGLFGGITVLPGNGRPELHVNRTTIANNGSGVEGAGIQIVPSNALGAKVVITNSIIDGNVVGIRADARGTTGMIDVAISDTRTAANTYHGIVALANGSGSARIVANRVSSNSNGAEGIRVVGAGAVIQLGTSVVTGNQIGIVAQSGGQVQSFGDNRIGGNVIEGATPVIIPFK